MESCGISRSTRGGQARELTAANHVSIVGDKIVELQNAEKNIRRDFVMLCVAMSVIQRYVCKKSNT